MKRCVSTKAERSARSRRLHMPIKMRVRQTDGTYAIQVVEVTVKKSKASRSVRQKRARRYPTRT